MDRIVTVRPNDGHHDQRATLQFLGQAHPGRQQSHMLPEGPDHKCASLEPVPVEIVRALFSISVESSAYMNHINFLVEGHDNRLPLIHVT